MHCNRGCVIIFRGVDNSRDRSVLVCPAPERDVCVYGQLTRSWRVSLCRLLSSYKSPWGAMEIYLFVCVTGRVCVCADPLVCVQILWCVFAQIRLRVCVCVQIRLDGFVQIHVCV